MRTAYMCAIDYQCELTLPTGNITVYRTLKELRAARTCIKECGYVKVKIQALKEEEK